MTKYVSANAIHSDIQLIAELIYQQDRNHDFNRDEFKNKYITDTVYTLRFLSISMILNEPILFKNYMKWFGSLAFYLEFDLPSMDRHFQSCILTFNKILTPDFYENLIQIWNDGVEIFYASYKSENRTIPNTDYFLQLLINMDSEKADEYIQNQINDGKSIKEIYLEIIQPTLYQVGDLWQKKIISVAKEHYITALMQNIIGKFYPMLFSRKQKSRHTITAVCAGNELHEIGLRMVVDFFEISGWDTIFLGSNIPIEMVVDQLIEFPTDVLAISATTISQLIDLKKLVDQIKKKKELSHIKILVGGKVFNETPNLWKTIGADLYASDPEQAILLAELSLGESYA